MSAISGLTRVWKSVVLVMAAPPDPGLVPSQRCTVEPLIHPPETVEAAGVCGVRVVDDAIFERERAQAGRLAQKRGDVRADRLRELRDWACRVEARTLIHVPKVVFDDTATLLLLGDRDAEVVVEVAVVRRGTREVPAHSSPVRLDVRERRTRDRGEHHVVVHYVQ